MRIRTVKIENYRVKRYSANMLISSLEDSDKAKINSAYTSFLDAIGTTRRSKR